MPLGPMATAVSLFEGSFTLSLFHLVFSLDVKIFVRNLIIAEGIHTFAPDAEQAVFQGRNTTANGMSSNTTHSSEGLR